MGQFTTTRLANSRVLVEGTDDRGGSNKIVLDSTEWDDLKAHSEHHQAVEEFDRAVEAFFAPITEAADAAAAVGVQSVDPASIVVLSEPQAAQEGRQGTLVELSKDSIILRLIEQGDTSRLIWVGDDLEVLEYSVETQPENAPAKKGFFS